MQIEFTRKNRDDHGCWVLIDAEHRYHGSWVADQFEDEFEYGNESLEPHSDAKTEFTADWLDLCLNTWFEMIKAPYSWQRVVFQEEAFIVEIRNEEPHNAFVVSGWNMMCADISPRFNSSYHLTEDMVSATIEVTECMKWMYQEFAGLGHDQEKVAEDMALEDYIVGQNKPVDLVGYAQTVGGEFRDQVAAVQQWYRKYQDSKRVVDHLYWATSEMHTRDLIGHDDFDQIGAALYIRDDEALVLRDASARV